jgi:hypothetical protein
MWSATQTTGQAQRHDEANSRSLQFCEPPQSRLCKSVCLSVFPFPIAQNTYIFVNEHLHSYLIADPSVAVV